MEKLLRRVLRYFFSGTLFIVPLVATVYFFFESFQWLDGLLNLPYPGVGFAIIILIITGLGYLTRTMPSGQLPTLSIRASIASRS